jgi:hypothetical protein
MSKITICDICESERVISLGVLRAGYRGGLKGDFCEAHARRAKELLRLSRKKFEAWLTEHIVYDPAPMAEVAKWPYKGSNGARQG